MPTLPIADKTTLDALKAKVDTNLDGKISQISGGIEWDAKTPGILLDAVKPESGGTATLFSVSGSGFITGIGMGSALDSGKITLTVDGTTVINEKSFAVSGGAAGGIGAIYRFESNATVTVKNTATGRLEISVFVSYVLD